jgi:hypothetical protein
MTKNTRHIIIVENNKKWYLRMNYKCPKTFSDLLGNEWIEFLITSDRYATQAKIHKTYLDKFLGATQLKRYQDYLLWQLDKRQIECKRYKKLEKIYTLTAEQQTVITDRLKYRSFSVDQYLSQINDYAKSDSILKNFVALILASGITPYNIIFSHFEKLDKYTINAENQEIKLLIDFDLFNDIHLLLLAENKGLSKNDFEGKYRNNLIKYTRESDIYGLKKILDIPIFYSYSIRWLNTPFDWPITRLPSDLKTYGLKKYLSTSCL